jgi:hypothetical protein
MAQESADRMHAELPSLGRCAVFSLAPPSGSSSSASRRLFASRSALQDDAFQVWEELYERNGIPGETRDNLGGHQRTLDLSRAVVRPLYLEGVNGPVSTWKWEIDYKNGEPTKIYSFQSRSEADRFQELLLHHNIDQPCYENIQVSASYSKRKGFLGGFRSSYTATGECQFLVPSTGRGQNDTSLSLVSSASTSLSTRLAPIPTISTLQMNPETGDRVHAWENPLPSFLLARLRDDDGSSTMLRVKRRFKT